MRRTAFSGSVSVSLLLVLLLTGHCLAQFSGSDSATTIRVGSDRDYPPYEYNDEMGMPTGFNVELIRAAAEAVGLRAEVRLGVWNEVRADLEAGRIDAIAGMYYSKARERVVDFSVPHNLVSSALFVREGSGIKALAQLRDKEIVVQKGDIMHDFLIEQGFPVRIIAVNDPLQGLQLMAAGKHDGVLLSSKMQGMYFINKHGIQNVSVVGTDLPARRYCFAVKKGDRELLQRLDEGLNILKHTGRYQEIYEKWFGIYEGKTLWEQSQPFIIALVVVLSLLAAISVITWVLRLQVKRQTRELLSSKERLRALFQTIPDLVWLKDVNCVYLACNRMFELFFGAREADIIGKTDYEFVSKDLADWFRERDRRAMEAGKPISNEEWVEFASDGRRVLLDTIKTPMYDGEGKLVGVLGIGRDITQRKKTEDALQKSEQRFRAIFNSTFQFTGLLTPDGGVIQANQAALDFAGIHLADIIHQPFWDTRWWRGKTVRVSQLRESIARAAKGEFIRYEVELQGADDTTGIFDFSLKPVFGEDGEVALLISEARDITGRKRTEEALEESRRELETLLSNLSGMAYRCRNDSEWTMVFVSEGCHALTGYPAEDVMHNRRISYDKIIHPEDREAVWTQVQEALQRHTHFQLNYRIVTAGGEVRWVWEQGAGVFSPTGELVFVEGFVSDITERRRAEDALRLNAERLGTLLKLDQMAGATGKELLEYGLEEAVRLTRSRIGYLGLMNADETGMDVHAWSRNVMAECLVSEGPFHFPIAGAGLWAEVVRQRRAIVTNDFKASHSRKRGWPEGHVEITRHLSVPIFAGQRIALIAGVGNKEEAYDDNDVQQLTLMTEGLWRLIELKQAEEERKKLENRLIQAEKMEAIGTLAGGIAHDFNNILAVITGYTELSQDAARGLPGVCHNMEQVLSAANRAKDLVMQILMFSRKTEQEKKPVGLAPIVKEVVKFMRASLPTTIEIRQTIDVLSDVIMADPMQMHQVLMNLCANAGHAMKETGGVLEVALRSAAFTSDDLPGPSSSRPGHYLELTVRDTGRGIPRENLERIFDPYFTTKGKGEGTGLGLAVVDGIVKEHGGEVSVYSQVGEGSLFRVYLPLLQEYEEASADKKEAIAPGKGETILFVDDEQMLVEVGKRLLESLGYRVVAETDAWRAIEAFRQGGGVFDLVITDKTMPHMTGYDLAQEVRKSGGDIPVILCSGFLEKEDSEKIRAFGISRLLTKPVSRDALARTVRDVLDKRSTLAADEVNRPCAGEMGK